jgi:hypothetical protein
MPRRDTADSAASATTRSRRPALDHLIRVGETHVGRGVFARRRIKEGLVLAEVHGETLADHPEDSSYVMELPSGRLLDPAPPLRFVNHSCDPNCELFYWEGDEENPQEDRLWLQTIRPIVAGEELSIDYSWPADAAIPCRCGTLNCRGWIVDPAELHLMPPDGQEPAANPPPSPA